MNAKMPEWSSLTSEQQERIVTALYVRVKHDEDYARILYEAIREVLSQDERSPA